MLSVLKGGLVVPVASVVKGPDNAPVGLASTSRGQQVVRCRAARRSCRATAGATLATQVPVLSITYELLLCERGIRLHHER